MEEEKKLVPAGWRIAAIAAMAACLLLCVLNFTKPAAPAEAPQDEQASEQVAPEEQADDKEAAGDEASDQDISGEAMLTLWKEEAPAKKALIEYVVAVTDPNSPDFIPEESRVATFDFDGTLFCETDPNYFDYTLLVHRVLEDPDYSSKASDFEKATAEKIVDQNENGTKYDELPIEHGQSIASSFKGMTPEEIYDYIHSFMEEPMPSYEGMKRGGGFYQPMAQVVNYLKANGFTVYIVSGTDRLIVRGVMSVDNPLDLPLRQVIGSDESLVVDEEEDEDTLNYTYDDDDELVTGGDFIVKNLKTNKVTVIEQEIGQKPVLSFGNSSGDFAMDNYAINDNPFRAMAFQLCCDDTERENGNPEKAEEMRQQCEEFGYVPVSMRDDWTTIYGDGVTYTGAKAK